MTTEVQGVCRTSTLGAGTAPSLRPPMPWVGVPLALTANGCRPAFSEISHPSVRSGFGMKVFTEARFTGNMGAKLELDTYHAHFVSTSLKKERALHALVLLFWVRFLTPLSTCSPNPMNWAQEAQTAYDFSPTWTLFLIRKGAPKTSSWSPSGGMTRSRIDNQCSDW